MRHTTHKLTPEQKESLFHQHKDLIYMIFCCNGYMLRQQVRKLFHLLSCRNEKDIEFDIAELICTGFLLQKTINKDTRTQMLYLSKYPKSQFLNVDSRDVAAVNWSEPKIFEQLFKINYIIEKIIPDMKKQDLEISMDNIILYLKVFNPHFKWGFTFYPSGDYYWFRQRRDFAAPFFLVALLCRACYFFLSSNLSFSSCS